MAELQPAQGPGVVRGADPRRILVVDDEPDLLRAVQLYLEDMGYLVFVADNGRDALEALRTKLPDLVVLDVRMPEMDGFEVLRRIREASNVPVIMLTVQSEEHEKVHGLRLGADDYVTKPFSQRELAARIAAVVRRAEQPAHLPKTELVVDEYLRIDFDRNEVWANGKQVSLTPTEYRLLYHLASNPGRVMTFESLLTKVWGWEYRDEDHYVRLYVSYLRQKLEPDPSRPKYILTEKGLGYRFVDYRRRSPSAAAKAAAGGTAGRGGQGAGSGGQSGGRDIRRTKGGSAAGTRATGRPPSEPAGAGATGT
jgi:two-component system KDP operon response regulator KdpE